MRDQPSNHSDFKPVPGDGQRRWHALSSDEIKALLDIPADGLCEQDAAARLAKHGRNVLIQRPGISVWRILIQQFESPLILILLISTIAAFVSREIEEALFIGIVLLLNALLGASQEYRAEKGARSLRKLISVDAAVKREGKVFEIDAQNLIPGDLIFLESGNMVPADIRLLSSNRLEVDESLLTGESESTAKDASWNPTNHHELAEIQNMAFAGTIVVRGRASGIVVETGSRTQLGKIAEEVQSEETGIPPLVQRIRQFSKTVAIAVTGVASIIAISEIFVRHSSIANAIEFAIALAISAIPEGLPIALTITLAVASSRMSRRNAIVRRLAAVEGLGSCTLIATDKTGTLTSNEQTIKRIITADGSEIDVDSLNASRLNKITIEIIRTGILCNESSLTPRSDGTYHRQGDAVDLAFLSFGLKLGLQRNDLILSCPLIHQIPFEPELQYAATWHELSETGKSVICVKGSPESVLEMCNLSDKDRQSYQTAAMKLAKDGYRTIALAELIITGQVDRHHLPRNPDKLNYLGCVGMIDPPRPGVREAIRLCHEAGLKIIMLTGDHRLTAQAIASDLGLINNNIDATTQVVTGRDIENATIEQLKEILSKTTVFARVTPEQKLNIVNAGMELGHFLAVTGDGANDAPAMRAANIAIAMGRSGTDVARDCADLVLSDDNFATIVSGIEEGRIAYDNIRKVIILLVSTGLGEILLVGMALISGYPLPLLPLQLLWLNVATEAIQDEALAFEPNEGDVMKRAPRPPDEPIFNRVMVERIAIGASVMGLVGFAVFAVFLKTGHSVPQARNALLLLMVLFENAHLANCRSELKSAFSHSPARSPALVFGAVLALVVHVIAMHTPWFQRVLQVEPVSTTVWITLVALALTILPVIEIHKWRCRNFAGKTSSM